MNNRITFSQAIEGYVMAAQARHLSPNTINDYLTTFQKLLDFLKNDPPIASITSRQVEAFLACQEVAKKTILNYHIGLSALWTWAVKEELVKTHILHQIEQPKPEKKAITPYSLNDIKRMMEALKKSKVYFRPGKKDSSHSLPNADRNRAMILVLLDTGIRASEL